VSSIEPNDGGGEVDGGKKVSGGFVVARGNRAILLELAVEILNEMPRLVHFFVEGALDFAIAFGWDNGRFSCRTKRFDDALVGIERFVGQKSIGLHLRQQHVGTLQIMGLARGEEKGERIAQGIDQGMNFSAQPAFAAPNRLVLAVFF
jgi:hypothetical protein